MTLADGIEVKLYKLTLERSSPFRSAGGTLEVITHILVRVALRSAPEVVGWGECPTLSTPGYAPETTDQAWRHMTGTLAPALVKAGLREPRELSSVLILAHEEGGLGGLELTSFSRAALEWAVWDLWAKRLSMPLANFLGAQLGLELVPPPVFVPAGATIGEPRYEASNGQGSPQGLENCKEYDEQIERIAASGISRVKVKVSPRVSVNALTRIVRSLPGAQVVADANESFDHRNPVHLGIIESFAKAGGMAIEQPFERQDFESHAWLSTEFPGLEVVLDESVNSFESAQKAIDMGSMGVLCIKPGRLGGVCRSAEVMKLCEGAGVAMYLGGMHEFGVGRYGNLALGALSAFNRVGDLGPSASYYKDDLARPPLELNKSRQVGDSTSEAEAKSDVLDRLERSGDSTANPAGFNLSDVPGIGCEVDEALCEELSGQSAVFRS